jgi:uncharacterized protein (TIGR04255 family)
MNSIDLKYMEAFARKKKGQFPHVEDVIQITTSFDTVSSKSTRDPIGKKLTNKDSNKIIMILPKQFSMSQLAPYTDWDELYDTTRENWTSFKKIIKDKQISQVSTRYINRIDIPARANDGVDLHKYFNVGLSLPPYAQKLALQQFHVNCTLSHLDGLKYQLQLLSVPPQLIDTMSFVVDIDLSTTEGVSPHEEKLWELIGSLRKYKNDLFESCITPETRRLFQ